MVITMNYNFKECRLCPRKCGMDRTQGTGFCGAGTQIKIARAAVHLWEEPCISGKEGSGTIFFSGCPLKCVFCQNSSISAPGVQNGQTEAYGREISPKRLQEICFELKAAKVNNINLVTPMHFAPQIRQALLPIKEELALPIVVNTGGYDSIEQLSFFDGLADVYLPDFKFGSSGCAGEMANAPGYPEVCKAALKEMFRQVGRPQKDDRGMLQKGVLVRHLILPGKRRDSLAVLEELHKMFEKEDVLLSVMSQYTPQPGLTGDLKRRITTFEQQVVMNRALELGFEGYFQQRSAAQVEFTPPFDLTGV